MPNEVVDYRDFRENPEKYLGGRTGKSKYNAKKREIDGITFDSIKEADRYGLNKMKVLAGKLAFFLMQVPFRIPGGVTYRVDFIEFSPKFLEFMRENPDAVRFIDVKGMETKEFKIKKKLVEHHFPVKIETL